MERAGAGGSRGEGGGEEGCAPEGCNELWKMQRAMRQGEREARHSDELRSHIFPTLIN